MRVEPDRLRDELTTAAADARIDPGSLVVWIVDEPRPAGTTPLAYLQPAGFVEPETVRVFRAVGAQRAVVHRLSAHRLAIWRDLPGIPEWALGPMLRHELEHARRWERSGPRFFEADDLLRAAVRAAGGDGYTALPSGARGQRRVGGVRSTGASGRPARRAARGRWSCGPWSRPDRPPADVVEATLAELARRDGARGSAYVESVRAGCAAWEPDTGRLRSGREGPEVMVVTAP